MRALRLMASWVLALFLAALLLWIADFHLFPGEGENVIFPLLAERSGIALWEPTGRFLVGMAHVLAALLVFIPWTRRLGALLAGLIAAAAAAMHLSWLGVELPTEGDVTPTDGGQLFYLSLALLVASVLLVFIHPGKEKPGFLGYR